MKQGKSRKIYQLEYSKAGHKHEGIIYISNKQT